MLVARVVKLWRLWRNSTCQRIRKSIPPLNRCYHPCPPQPQQIRLKRSLHHQKVLHVLTVMKVRQKALYQFPALKESLKL